MNEKDLQIAHLLLCMKEIIRRAVLTLAALRDPDRRFLGMSKSHLHIVNEVHEAYGYASASVRSFRPTPYEVEQMDVILPWLAWLRREEGDAACRRILSWAMGAPPWKIAQREKCSDRTVLNRIDRSVAAIIDRFVGVGITVEIVDEPFKGTQYAMIYEKPRGPHGGPVKIKKVYVGGVGYYKGGKRMRTAQEAVDERKLSA